MLGRKVPSGRFPQCIDLGGRAHIVKPIVTARPLTLEMDDKLARER